MATPITIVFWIIACVTLVYISYTACKHKAETIAGLGFCHFERNQLMCRCVAVENSLNPHL